MTVYHPDRPCTTVILAISVDGKITDYTHAAARFGSGNDKAHLETQIAQADAVLFGAGTLRAYGTTLRVSAPELLQQRHSQGKPAQPIQLVCSASGQLDSQLRFFQQPLPRWLLTTTAGAEKWADQDAFEKILILAAQEGKIDWLCTFQQLSMLGIKQLAVLGGGTLVAALLEAELIDQLWLTICPLLLGGANAPTLVEGAGFLEKYAPRLSLLEVRSLDHEVFLHYQVNPAQEAL